MMVSYRGVDTPLINACAHGNKVLTKYLIENGVDVNKGNNNGITPLMKE